MWNIFTITCIIFSLCILFSFFFCQVIYYFICYNQTTTPTEIQIKFDIIDISILLVFFKYWFNRKNLRTFKENLKIKHHMHVHLFCVMLLFLFIYLSFLNSQTLTSPLAGDGVSYNIVETAFPIQTQSLLWTTYSIKDLRCYYHFNTHQIWWKIVTLDQIISRYK